MEMTMSTNDKTKACTKDKCLTYFNAASAGVAQAFALAAQNAIDEYRQNGVIEFTVMGNAYAKWLANPQMGAQYQPIISSVREDDKRHDYSEALSKFVAVAIQPEDSMQINEREN